MVLGGSSVVVEEVVEVVVFAAMSVVSPAGATHIPRLLRWSSYHKKNTRPSKCYKFTFIFDAYGRQGGVFAAGGVVSRRISHVFVGASSSEMLGGGEEYGRRSWPTWAGWPALQVPARPVYSGQAIDLPLVICAGDPSYVSSWHACY